MPNQIRTVMKTQTITNQIAPAALPLALGGLLLLAALLLVIQPARAGDQTLAGHVPPVTASLTPLGRLAPTNQLYLAIGLRLPNQPALLSFLGQLYDPQNPNFRHYLTPEQFTEAFGPTPQDYQSVLDFAIANGMVVSQTHSNRLLVDVTASVADIERAFHVTLLEYQHPTETRTFYAPNVEPSLDATIPVLHISGLNNCELPRPATGSGTNGLYAGGDFRAAYIPNVSLNGAGQYVGLLEFDDYYHSACNANVGYKGDDVQAYEDIYGLPHVPITTVPVDGGVIQCNMYGGAEEVTLDIDMAICVAPGLAGLVLYEAPWIGTAASFDDMLSAMAYPVRALQLSSSWILRDTDPNADSIYLEFAAQGQSFFQSSGDHGAYCSFGPDDDWEDSPYVTIVGGTILSTTGPGGGHGYPKLPGAVAVAGSAPITQFRVGNRA